MATWIHRFLVSFFGPIYRFFTRLKVEGLDTLPEGGYVMGFNHPGILEIFHVAFAHKKPIFMMGKAEAFKIPVFGYIIRNWGGQIPIHRGANNQQGLQEAVDRLRAGDPIAMAPEGTNNKFGPLGRGRSGAARLALAAGVPMVPVAVHRRTGGRPRVVFGEPMHFERFYGENQNTTLVRRVTDQFMTELARLLGENYNPASAPDYAALKGHRPQERPPGA